MRALIHDVNAPQGLRLAEVAEPVPQTWQALVEVHSVSLNFGELAYLNQQRNPGEVPGWDAAGVVLQAAADGSGPPTGTRVATFGWLGAWAERRAVDITNLAVVPDNVDLGAASTLPVAGTTALQALRKLGSVLGRRVLITGASGGVGRIAVQLAARAGAEVVATVGDLNRGDGLRELGAAQIVTTMDKIGSPVFGVLDNVGGTQLAEAFALLDKGGIAQSIGKASRQSTTIDFETERLRAGNRRLEPFVISTPLGTDLAYLIDLLAQELLHPQIGWRSPWDRAAEAADALLSRRIPGKAVLDITPIRTLPTATAHRQDLKPS